MIQLYYTMLLNTNTNYSRVDYSTYLHYILFHFVTKFKFQGRLTRRQDRIGERIASLAIQRVIFLAFLEALIVALVLL